MQTVATARQWLEKPREIKLNTDTNLLKVVAVITMFIDHLGATLLPQYPVLRVIGRIAFPLFCWCIVVGSVYTRDLGKYIFRLQVLFVISQPFYWLAMGHDLIRKPNILLTLVVALTMIYGLRERKYFITLAMAGLAFFSWQYLDYGWYGLWLILILYLLRHFRWASLVVVLFYMVYTKRGGSYSLLGLKLQIQAFAVVALPLIYIPFRTRIKLHKYFFYAFYRAHLLLLYLIQQIKGVLG